MTFNSLFQDNWSNYFEFFSSLAYCTQFFSCYTQNRICLRNHPFVFFSSLFCLLLWHAIITNTKKDTREEYTLSKFKRVSCSSQNSFRLCSEIYIFFLKTNFLFFFSCLSSCLAQIIRSVVSDCNFNRFCVMYYCIFVVRREQGFVKKELKYAARVCFSTLQLINVNI